MSKKKNKVLICLFFAGIMSFVSCGKNADKKKKNEDIPKENIVNIYHSEEQGIAIGDEYLLKQPESFNASLRRKIFLMKNFFLKRRHLLRRFLRLPVLVILPLVLIRKTMRIR